MAYMLTTGWSNSLKFHTFGARGTLAGGWTATSLTLGTTLNLTVCGVWSGECAVDTFTVSGFVRWLWVENHGIGPAGGTGISSMLLITVITRRVTE